MESRLYDWTEAKEQSLSHREEVLVDSRRIFDNQYLIDWEEESRRIDALYIAQKRKNV